MNIIDLEVKGMSCGGCVKRITQALRPLAGVDEVEVDLQAGHVRVSGERLQGSNPLISALNAAGYPTRLATSTAQTKTSDLPSGNSGQGGCCG